MSKLESGNERRDGRRTRRSHRRAKNQRRRGHVLVVVSTFLVGLLVVVAFAIDYGYLLVMRTDMQRAADSAALAAVRELTPDGDGSQVGKEDAARTVARAYANLNIRENQTALTIPDADIEVGHYDRATINSGTVTVLNTGSTLDTVRVTLRRDGITNQSVGLFFGRIVGVGNADMTVTATAVLRPVKVIVPGDGVLPIAVDLTYWDSVIPGASVSIYGDGHVEDPDGNVVPGNWGTVDIGNTSNSTSELSDQIVNGLRQDDLDFLHNDTGPDGLPRIPTNTEVPPDTWVQGETGLSGGIQNSLNQIIGEIRIVPVIDQMAGGSGNTSEYHIVKWAVVEVSSAQLHGAQHRKHVTVTKTIYYDGSLKPNPDLSDNVQLIDGAWGPAGLVE